MAGFIIDSPDNIWDPIEIEYAGKNFDIEVPPGARYVTIFGIASGASGGVSSASFNVPAGGRGVMIFQEYFVRNLTHISVFIGPPAYGGKYFNSTGPSITAEDSIITLGPKKIIIPGGIGSNAYNRDYYDRQEKYLISNAKTNCLGLDLNDPFGGMPGLYGRTADRRVEDSDQHHPDSCAQGYGGSGASGIMRPDVWSTGGHGKRGYFELTFTRYKQFQEH